jgi:hypothetical protein
MSQPLGVVGQPIQAPEGYHLLLVTKREIRPLSIIRNEVVGSIEDLGRKRLDGLVKHRFGTSKVAIAPTFGSWTGTEVVAR